MVELLRQLRRFLTSMDARAWTSFAVSLVMIAFVVLMFLFGRDWLGLEEQGRLAEFMDRVAVSPFAVLGVVALYVLLALTGFPQFLLLAATVFAFGPLLGAVYAWIATMISATFTFGLGHFLGGGMVKRLAGTRAQPMIALLARRGVLASALVRVVPSAPFIVVNAAGGAAHIPLWKFWLGSGIGFIPKILLVATIGAFAPSGAVMQDGMQGVADFFTSRDPRHLMVLAAAILAWLGFLLLMRRIYVGMRRRSDRERG